MTPVIAAFCLALLIPFAAAGIALINAGLTRTRSVAQSLFTSLCCFAIAAVIYFICGFAFQGAPSLGEKALQFQGKSWGLIGTGALFLRGSASPDFLTGCRALFGMFAIGLTAVISLGSGTERWRIAASFSSAAVLAGWTFPLFAHWVWGGGWLAALGTNYELGRGFLDAAGSGCIQVVGGLTALQAAWILGPRRGKYNSHGIPAATPGHNAAFVLFGCILALVGWLGLNCSGAVLLAGTDLPQLPWIAINTLLSASGGILAAAATTRIRFGKPDSSLCANGWIGGLAAGSAGCNLLKPSEALLIGLVAGTLVIFVVEILELRLRVDDPSGSIAVHGASGLWGLLAVGFFTGTGQLAAQLAGIATLLGFIFPMSYALNLMLNRFVSFRVAPEGERQGVDLFELGAGAYPEFMIHRDDFTIR